MPKLENWSLILDEGESPYTAPELIKRRLQGNVYGHKAFNDGDPVTTSSLTVFDFKGLRAETKNTVYKLGKISEEYFLWCRQNNINLEDYGIKPKRVRVKSCGSGKYALKKSFIGNVIYENDHYMTVAVEDSNGKVKYNTAINKWDSDPVIRGNGEEGVQVTEI